jgi:2-succinyl-6-hydroxy-2,4-cyclohexadiene-1-carboxylate synthase
VFFEATGDKNKNPIVFLHGFLGNLNDFRPYINHFSKSMYCMAFDMPGHGKSGIYDVEELISLIPKGATLVGYSMGGRIGLKLFLEHKDHFKNAIFLSTNFGLETEAEKLLRKEKENNWILELKTKTIDAFIRDWYRSDLFKHTTILKERYQQNKEFLIYAIEKFSLAKQPNFWNSLSKIRHNTLFLYGSEDDAYKSYYQRLKNLNLRAFFIENASHAIHIEKPELCINKIEGMIFCDNSQL